MSPTGVLIHEKLKLYILDLFTATRHHPRIDGTLLSAQAHADCSHILRTWRVISGGKPLSEAWNYSVPVTTLDVSDEDVRWVFPQIVSHRLRVRDGPQDESLASAVFASVDNDKVHRWSDGKGTLLDILVEIMNTT